MEQLKHGCFNQEFPLTRSALCSSRPPNLPSTPVSPSLCPPGPFLLSALLEKSQGKKLRGYRACYHRNGFFMARCWNWKNYSRSSSFTAQSWDDTAWSMFILKNLTLLPLLPKAHHRASAAHQSVSCTASSFWISGKNQIWKRSSNQQISPICIKNII